jgi:hypothetical protein
MVGVHGVFNGQILSVWTCRMLIFCAVFIRSLQCTVLHDRYNMGTGTVPVPTTYPLLYINFTLHMLLHFGPAARTKIAIQLT